MKKVFLLSLGAAVGIQFAPVATADTITPHLGSIIGGASGVGFSFVPLVDLQITQLGFRSYNGSDPLISIWSGTNIIGGWDFGMDSGTNNQMIYAPYSQNLTAGQQYSITLQDADIGAVAFGAYFTNGVGFSVSPLLTNYVGFTVTSTGTFTNFSTNVFISAPISRL